MIVPRGVSKASGLAVARERLGVSAAETIAVGDDGNDLALFDGAGLRVAVGNAIDAVKAAADVVLDAPNGEGVAAFVGGLIPRADGGWRIETAPRHRRGECPGGSEDRHP